MAGVWGSGSLYAATTSHYPAGQLPALPSCINIIKMAGRPVHYMTYKEVRVVEQRTVVAHELQKVLLWEEGTVVSKNTSDRSVASCSCDAVSIGMTCKYQPLLLLTQAGQPRPIMTPWWTQSIEYSLEPLNAVKMPGKNAT